MERTTSDGLGGRDRLLWQRSVLRLNVVLGGPEVEGQEKLLVNMGGEQEIKINGGWEPARVSNPLSPDHYIISKETYIQPKEINQSSRKPWTPCYSSRFNAVSLKSVTPPVILSLLK